MGLRYTDAAPREATQAAGDEGGILLVPADHGRDLRIHQGVEYRIDLGAGNAKDILDSLRLEILREEARAAAFTAHVRFARLAPFFLGFDRRGGSSSSNASFMVMRALVAAGKPQ